MSKDNVTRRISIYVNGQEVSNSLKGVDGAIAQVRNRLRLLNTDSETYDQDSKELVKTIDQLKQRQADYRNELGLTSTSINKTGFSIKEMTSSIIAAFSIGSIVTAFVGAVRGAFKTINDFEQGVADLSAITGAAGDDLKYLKDQAIILGETTKGGATAVVEAYKLIASAKPELLENVDALNQVTEATLLLAKASGMEMPEAAIALTDAMNQFGAEAEQATLFVDALANGAKYGAAEIPQVTEALLKFGAVAKSSNINIQESTALIELLAENGLKGEMAGTALRNVLLKLSAPDALPKEARVEMERLGISMEFLKDKTIPIQEKFEALKPLLKDNASIVKVFGLENASAAINVIGHTERLKDLTSKMNDVGTAQEQAAIKMDTVNGKTELLKSKYDSLILSIGSGDGIISGFFKFMIDGANAAITDLIRLNTSWDDLFKKAGQEGKKSGTNAFQNRFNNLNTGTNKERAMSIKAVAVRDYKMYMDAYRENEKKIKNFDPYAINFGESGKDLNQEKERLTKNLAENAAIIKAAGGVILKDKKKINKEDQQETKKNAETQIEADKKLETTRETARLKKQQLDKQSANEELDRVLGLAKAKAEVAKAELDFFIANERSKLDSTKALTPEIVAAENDRLDLLKDKQLTALAEDRLAKVEKAEAEAKSAEELANLKLAIDYNYEAQRLDIENGFAETKRQNQETLKVSLAEQLALDNELAIEEAATKAEADKIKQEQDYQDQLNRYAKLYQDKKITEEEYNRFKKTAAAKQDELDRVRELQQVQGTLGGLNNIAGALGEMFGQSKELAIVQAGINGAMAVTSILAQYPKFDGGFAMWAAIAAAGITTIAQVAKISSAKAPASPKFFYGGATGSNAALGYDQFGPVTGYVHKNEYVIPEVMTQDPQFADTIGWLEANRQQKIRGFVDGGPASPGAVSVNSATDNTSQLIQTINILNGILANGLIAKVNLGYKEVRDISEMSDEINSSKNNGTIG